MDWFLLIIFLTWSIFATKDNKKNIPQASVRSFFGCPAVYCSCSFPPVCPLKGAPPSNSCHLKSLSLFITHFPLHLVLINTTALAFWRQEELQINGFCFQMLVFEGSRGQAVASRWSPAYTYVFLNGTCKHSTNAQVCTAAVVIISAAYGC